MLGPAPILDFDGTLALLDVDWTGLRKEMKVERIDELWSRHGNWETITKAEVKAAAVATPMLPVITLLSTVRCYAILTSNDASAVHRFIGRFPELRQRLSIVVGREELGGPKTDFATFQLGLQRCLSANDQGESAEPSTYVGDSAYELDFARRLGLIAVDVKDLIDTTLYRKG